MWFDESVFYHIYPLGFCGAPKQNDGNTVNRLEKLEKWIPHLAGLNVNALYLGPVFDSDSHGYDTRDYAVIDCRLGDKAMFKSLCGKLRQAGVRVVLDGVFNHVGRGFWAFADVREKRQSSPYKDWFQIDFSRNSNYNDGFWYEGWEGHYELVKLNLRNPAVVDHLLGCIGGWIDDYGIDGLRLDVAYSLDKDFMGKLRSFTAEKNPEFFLLGECLHGDYNQFVAPGLLDSCTNYECYKGLYSSFNESNFFEIAYSLNRQFGSESWSLYKGKHLLSFVDNHDVTRIASILREPGHLPLIYGLMFTMPGIPCVYYGSEWAREGKKEQGDDALRPCVDFPAENELTVFLKRLGEMYRKATPLFYGDYRQIFLTNRQIVFRREYEGKAVIVAINSDSASASVQTGVSGPVTDLLTGEPISLSGSVTLPPCSFRCWGLGVWDTTAQAIPETPQKSQPVASEPIPERNASAPAIEVSLPTPVSAVLKARLEARALEIGGANYLNHGRRVYHLCELIAEREKLAYDERVLLFACYFHDISVFPPYRPTGDFDHAEESARLIPDLAGDYGYSGEEVSAIAEAVAYHEKPGKGSRNETILLRNADAIDNLGALTVARYFLNQPVDVRDALDAMKRRCRDYSDIIDLPSVLDLAKPRIETLERFIQAYEEETFGIY